MRIIAVCNQKGGTAKTTTTVNLGAALARLGKNVLLIDLDPQGNLTYSFGISPTKGTIADVLQGKKKIEDILEEREGLKVAPGSLLLSDIEISLVNKIGRERILKDKLASLKGFDFVFIDSPPSLSILTVNALNAAQEVIIPAQMEVLSLQGLNQLIGTIEEVKAVLNKSLRVGGIVASMYDSRRKLSEEVRGQIQKTMKERVFKSVIRECVRIAEAPSFAKSVLTYSPSCNGAEDFLSLAKEFSSN